MNKTLAIALVTILGTGSVAFAHGGGPGKRMQDLDANSDGKVTKAELKKQADEHFTKLDKNKDGRVTLDEAKAFGEAMRAEHVAHWAEHGKQGKAPNDRKGPPADFEKRMQERAQKHFAERDQNGDGAIDRAEHDRAVEERFARMDKNGDGALTADELSHGHGFRGRHGKGGGTCDHDGGEQSQHGKGMGRGGNGQGMAGSGAER